MARCGCEELAPGVSECGCAFGDTGFGQWDISGVGSVSNPFVIDFLNSEWQDLPNTYVNGWSPFVGSEFNPPQYKTLWGSYIVLLRGRLVHAAAFVKGQTILTGLALNIRPTRTKFLLAQSGKPTTGDNGQITITNAGVMTCEVASSIGAAFINLDGMHYEVEP